MSNAPFLRTSSRPACIWRQHSVVIAVRIIPNIDIRLKGRAQGRRVNVLGFHIEYGQSIDIQSRCRWQNPILIGLAILNNCEPLVDIVIDIPFGKNDGARSMETRQSGRLKAEASTGPFYEIDHVVFASLS